MKDKELPVISLTELAKHNTAGDLWLAIHGTVYDVSKWHMYHPGGKIILAYAGWDVSDIFELFHPPRVAHMLAPMRRITIEGMNCPVDSCLIER